MKILVLDERDKIVQLEQQKINWKNCGIDEVWMTSDCYEAIQKIGEIKTDIVFCNFELNNNAGIKLIKYLENMHTVFLCIMIHRNQSMKFQKPVLKYGSNLEYIFFPIPREKLEEKIKHIVGFMRHINDKETVLDYGYWFIKNLTVYQELFWKDLLKGVLPSGKKNILEIARQRNISLTQSGYYILRMKGMQDTGLLKNWAKSDKMCAIRNLFVSIYDEYLLSTAFDDEYHVTAVLQIVNENMELSRKDIYERSQEITGILKETMGIKYLICICRDKLEIQEICQNNSKLLKITEKYMGGQSAVIYDDDSCYEEKELLSRARLLKWEMLLENEAFVTLQEELDIYFEKLENELVTRDALYTFLLKFWSMLSEVINNKKIDAQNFGLEEAVKIVTANPLTTLQDMRSFCVELILRTRTLFSGGEEPKLLVVAVKKYIAENIYQNIDRQMISEYVKYHPDYLSRIFKEYTGESLMNYIQNEKIKCAIFLFTETSLSVSQVAERLGYSNFSYFSQLFKKKTGYGIREYKKRYLQKQTTKDTELLQV